MNRILTLNGRDYPLRFSINALCCLEEKTGLNLSRLQSAQFSCLRGLIWCGLMESEKGLTLEAAGDLLEAHLRSGGEIQAVSDTLAQALGDACFFPKGMAKGTERR